MKTLHAAVVVFAILIVGTLTTVWQWTRPHVDAQDLPTSAKRDARAKTPTTEEESVTSLNDRPFPTFYVEEILTILKAGAEDLIEKKLAKNSDDLRQHLDRTQFATKLPRAATQELSPQELYRRATESVFLVAGLTKPTDEDSSWQTAFSTAFAVHEDGILSTSAHVFDHEDHDDVVVVMDVHGKVFPVLELLAADREADTCLFRIGTKGLKPLSLGTEIPPGSAIRVMGHPGDSFFFFSAGHIGNYEHDEDGLTWLNVTADFGQGSSGGPVMDSAGNIVGQVSRTYTLYAGGETRNRRRRPRMTRQTIDAYQKDDEKKETANDDVKDETEAKSKSKKSADPQMVFKACTPVSAIRALVK